MHQELYEGLVKQTCKKQSNQTNFQSVANHIRREGRTKHFKVMIDEFGKKNVQNIITILFVS